MKKSGIRILTIFAVLFPFLSFSQWEAVYHGADSTNEITGISFYTATEGYIASGSYIGYTQDGGKSFQKKTISFSNVNFNGYGVNLTFGFTPAGITALSKDRLLVYGDYGLEPAILYSADAGNTFKLVYHKNIPLNTSNVYNKVREMRFYNSTTGYAIQNDEIIKTTDGGQTWTISLRYENLGFADLSFPDATTGYAVSRSNVYKMNTSWGFWSELPNAPAGATKVSFVSSTTGYLHCTDNNGSRYYKTTNGGANWIPCSTADLRVPSAEDMEFVSETTGFVSTEGYQIFKTTDGGKSWELCKGSNTFTYLNYGFSRLFFYNGQTGWAGGYHDYLAKTTTGGDPTFPNARFKINKASFCTTGVVQLENHSRSGYNYQWYLNGSLLSTSYNASYSADASPYDTIRLVVSNGVDSDTAEEIVEAQAFGQFTFTSRPESDTACTEQGTYILIPNSDPNTYYTAYRGNIGDGWGYGNGGLLKLKCQYSGNSALIQYRVDATRTTACGTERKTNYHDIYFYSPLIDVAAKADTVCSGRQHFVTVTNSLWGYEYWVDSTKRVPGNGGVIKLPFTTGDRYTGYYPFWGNYATLRLKIFARHATWGCRNVFPRAEVDAVIRDPWAYAVAREYEYKTGQTINIQNNTIDGHSYVWRTEGEGVVNNGTTLFEPANLSFTQPGTYRINLYATSKEGCTDTASTAVQVVEASSITRRQMEVCKTDTLQSEYYYKATDSYKDASGNLYITGAKMKLNYHFSTKGLEGWFLIKKDRSGKVIWEKSNTINVGEGHIITENVVADAYENVYIYGHLFRDRAGAPAYFVDTVNFGGGVSIAFVAKLNKAGRLLWMRRATNASPDPRWYPISWSRPFSAGSLVMGKNNDLYLKLASDYARFEFGDTTIRGNTDETFLFHFNQDGQLLDHLRFPSRDGASDTWLTNWDHYHHTPKMQWNSAGNLMFTAVLDSSKTISSVQGVPLSFDTRKINTVMLVYDTAQRKFTSVLPIFKKATGERSASLPLAFTTDEQGNYYTAAYNRVQDTLRPGAGLQVFHPDLSKTTAPSHKLKTILAGFDKTGQQLWQKEVDGLRPIGMHMLNRQLFIGGENYTADFYKLAGHAYNSNIGEPYYFANSDTLFAGFPSPSRKKISTVTDGNTITGTEGNGGIDLLFITMNSDGSGVQLKTFGKENDERLHSIGKDSCGNLWGLGYTDLRSGQQSSPSYLYNLQSATLHIWNWNYDNACRTGICTSVKPAVRFDPVIKTENCIDSTARIVWSSSNVDKVHISYRKQGETFRYLVKDYPADSLKLFYNPAHYKLSGNVEYRIEATDGSAMDTLQITLSVKPPKTFLGRDTVVCYYEVFPLRSLEGPYHYKWTGGNWNEGIETLVPSGAAGQVGVTITDTVSGCSVYDFMTISRKAFFPQAKILVDSSSKERIVSTECSTKHEWRLNGRLLPDTGCVIIPKDTGTYSVATVLNGCVSPVYSGSRGYYYVDVLPRKVQWIKPSSPALQCVDSIYTVRWTASPVIEKVNIRVRRANEPAYTTLLSGIGATAGEYSLNLRTFNLQGQFSLQVEEDGNSTVNDSISVRAGTKHPFSLGPDIRTCAGTPVTINGPSAAGLTYSWSTGSNAQQLTITPTDLHVYSLTVATAAGCQTMDSILVTGIDVPRPVIFRDTSNTLRTNYCGTAHRWYLDGNVIAGETACSIPIKKGGVYTVMLENINCSSVLSEPLNVPSPSTSTVVVGPNPATDRITLTAKITSDNSEVQIRIVGENGTQYLFRDYGKQNSGTFTTDINLSSIQGGGLYFIQVTIGSEVQSTKFMIVR